jgi:hypothetical protein
MLLSKKVPLDLAYTIFWMIPKECYSPNTRVTQRTFRKIAKSEMKRKRQYLVVVSVMTSSYSTTTITVLGDRNQVMAFCIATEINLILYSVIALPMRL